MGLLFQDGMPTAVGGESKLVYCETVLQIATGLALSYSKEDGKTHGSVWTHVCG